MSKVVVTVNNDVREAFNGSFQVRLSSLESCSKFFIRNVVSPLAGAHCNSLDRLIGTIDLNEDENDCVPKRGIRSELVHFLTDGI